MSNDQKSLRFRILVIVICLKFVICCLEFIVCAMLRWIHTDR